MQRTKLLIIFIFIVLLQFKVAGQNNVGVKAAVGVGYIPLTDNSATYPATNEKTSLPAGGQVGIYFRHAFDQRSALGADLLYNNVNTSKSYDRQYESGAVHHNLLIHFNYLSLPVRYEFQVRKLIFSAGFQTSLCLGGSFEITTGLVGSEEIIGKTGLDFSDFEGWEFDRVDFGPKIGLTYQLFDYLALEGSFYYGLNDPLNENSIYWQDDWRIRQFTLGVNYQLTRKK